jgi:cytochrome P450 family 2 subfamily U polypeptide 1
VYATNFKKFHQLTLTIMKQFGYGRLGGLMESRIQDEVADMIAEFKAAESQPTVPSNVVDVSVINVIASILFGRRYERNDPEVHAFIHHNGQLVKASLKIIPLAMIPALRCIPYYRRALDQTRTLALWYDEVFEQKIGECERDKNETPCFIRSFIEAEGSQTYDKMQLICTMQDLVMAGSETSATTINWSIFLLANHQDIQTRLQTEIDSVVPRGRLPSLDDRLHMTNVEAFIIELMRFKTIVPLGLAHETSGDAVVHGFFLPTSTLVSFTMELRSVLKQP